VNASQRFTAPSFVWQSREVGHGVPLRSQVSGGSKKRNVRKWPLMNADQRGLKNKVLIGVYLRASAAKFLFSARAGDLRRRYFLKPRLGRAF
jgi:hypothetical protein